jgi:hypothetical protein
MSSSKSRSDTLYQCIHNGCIYFFYLVVAIKRQWSVRDAPGVLFVRTSALRLREHASEGWETQATSTHGNPDTSRSCQACFCRSYVVRQVGLVDIKLGNSYIGRSTTGKRCQCRLESARTVYVEMCLKSYSRLKSTIHWPNNLCRNFLNAINGGSECLSCLDVADHAGERISNVTKNPQLERDIPFSFGIDGILAKQIAATK